MEETQNPVVVLEDEESWSRLQSQQVGRLVTHVGEVTDIFPVNFIVDEGTILFRTAQGSKLFELTINDEVLFEADDYSESEAWSVVVRGRAHMLSTSAEVERADSLLLVPWIPTLKYAYVRIEPTTVSGRSFVRGPEPDRYGVQQY